MEILVQPFGEFYTNCYIVNREIIIDPSKGAFEFIKKYVKKPIAIINTHGHFDHIWDNQKVKEYFDIPIYIHKDDEFLLSNDPFSYNPPKSKADYLLEEGKIKIDKYEINILHMPGHTPGTILIEFENDIFSGDFIFDGSIGRVDFPFSNPKKMKDSIKKFLNINFTKDKRILPGHSGYTTIKKAKKFLPNWIDVI